MMRLKIYQFVIDPESEKRELWITPQNKEAAEWLKVLPWVNAHPPHELNLPKGTLALQMYYSPSDMKEPTLQKLVRAKLNTVFGEEGTEYEAEEDTQLYFLERKPISTPPEQK